VGDHGQSKLSARASKGALERWFLCNTNSGDKQRVDSNLSFIMELKVLFLFFPWLSTGASSPSFISFFLDVCLSDRPFWG
jgi:hypothetical protein